MLLSMNWVELQAETHVWVVLSRRLKELTDGLL